MSILALGLLLQSVPLDQRMAEHLRLTRAGIACKATAVEDDIVVCALREADKKYRVPFVTTQAIDDVPYETDRVLEDVMFQCGVSGPFLARCRGMVGVTVTAGFDGEIVRKRELAR